MIQRLLSLCALALFVPAANAAVVEGACGKDLSLPTEMERTGHVSVRLNINGVATRLLVDTGANANTLDTTEGQRFKFEILPGTERKPGEGRTKLNVSLGAVDFGGQVFSVMDLGFINIPSKRYGTEPFSGQLGAPFFVEFKARIDFAEMMICLQAPTTK